MNTQTRPRVGLGVLVLKEGKVLVGKRIGAHGANTWQPPGGHLEMNETWEQCARREVKEETGMEIEKIEFVQATNDIMNSEGKHYITIFVKAQWKSGEPEVREPEKCLGWEWAEWNAVPSPQFLPFRQLIMSGYHPFATLHNKLVRDNIPQLIAQSGDIAKYHQADAEEFREHLRAKLIEEVNEYLESGESEELADILEVIHTITALDRVNREQLQLLQKEKREDKGGFNERIILDKTQ